MSGTFTDTTGRTLSNLGPNTRACPTCDYQSNFWTWRAACSLGEVVMAGDARWVRVCPRCEGVCETTEAQR